MMIQISMPIEEQLQDLASKRGESVDVLVEEAIREYLTAASITDLDPQQVAETQMALAAELPGISEWKDGGE